MAESEIDRLERSVATLVNSVNTLTENVGRVSQDVSANRESISKLHEALKLVSIDVEKHGIALHRIELEAAKEEGRKQASGDLQTKLREHDDAARDIKALRVSFTVYEDVVGKLKQAHEQQRGILIAISVISPIIVTLVAAYVGKLLGLGVG